MALLITENYRKQNAQLHAERPDYGSFSGSKFAGIVREQVERYKARSILDYGCGKGMLRGALLIDGYEVVNYDPAVEEWAADPDPAEYVVCNDVLEHIEPDLLDNVLDHLQSKVLKAGFFTIATGPAQKTLPDGRNAHLIQQPARWWLPRLCERFNIVHVQRDTNGAMFMALVEAA